MWSRLMRFFVSQSPGGTRTQGLRFFRPQVVHCKGNDLFPQDVILGLDECFRRQEVRQLFYFRYGFALGPVVAAVVGTGVLAGIAAANPRAKLVKPLNGAVPGPGRR